MKIQIRSNVFETNSSSTHSLAIADCNDVSYLHIPDTLQFKFGEFGWGVGIFTDCDTKASYIWTAIAEIVTGSSPEDVINNFNIYKHKLITLLNDIGLYDISFDLPQGAVNYGNNKYYLKIPGFIDHPEDLKDIIQVLFDDPQQLLAFIFHPDSALQTGNDNIDDDFFFHLNWPIAIDDYKYFYDKGN